MSCSDDDDFENTGTLTIDGTVYELSQGIIYYRGTSEGRGCNFDIDLLSSDIDIESETGTGQIVALEMFTETTDNLKDGSYTVPPDETFPAGTFCGIIVTGFDAETEEGSVFYIIKSGSSIVAKSGNLYEFTINVLADQLDEYLDNTVATNVPISCYYKGTLNKRDF